MLNSCVPFNCRAIGGPRFRRCAEAGCETEGAQPYALSALGGTCQIARTPRRCGWSMPKHNSAMQICEKLLCSKYFLRVSFAHWELRKLFCCAVLFFVAAVAGSFAADVETNELTEPFVGVRVIHCNSAVPRTVDMWMTEIDGRAPGVSFLVTPSNG